MRFVLKEIGGRRPEAGEAGLSAEAVAKAARRRRRLFADPEPNAEGGCFYPAGGASASFFRKYSIVRVRPSFSETLGFQSSSARARLMSG